MRFPRKKTAGRAGNWLGAAMIACCLSTRLLGQAAADEPKKNQVEDKGTPPAAPSATPVDPGVAPVLPHAAEPPPPKLRRETAPPGTPPPQAPSAFNPDPGAAGRAAVKTDSFFRPLETEKPSPESAPLPPSLALPRANTERPVMGVGETRPEARAGMEPLPADQALPRARTRSNRFIFPTWHAPERDDRKNASPENASSPGVPENSQAVTDRWRGTGFTPWRRYASGDIEDPYYRTEPDLWHYYRQSILKGDLPFRGQDLFLALTASSETVAEDRKLVTPSGVTSSEAGSYDFFGKSRSRVFSESFAVQADLFRGETVFKPVEWLVRIKPVFNYTYVDTKEVGIISPAPRGSLTGGGTTAPSNTGIVNPGDVGSFIDPLLKTGPASLDYTKATNRGKAFVALQEAFVEKHLFDLSSNYDFLAVKAGNQTFNSDFRGFVFNDTNLGVRLFGNYDNNHWQYNLAFFDLREKDTNSDLNTFNSRGQRVLIANVYRQDFLVKGYTAQLSFHGSWDEGSLHYDTNGAVVRPAPLGTVAAHAVRSAYLGWAGDGHVGRLNISHAAYVVVGRDDLNGLAGRAVNIRAAMAAAEVSYDRDWVRFKASFFYATGDHDSTDGLATGFDSIIDNTNFTAGPFSYYARQGFNLAGTAVNVKQRFSLLPNLRTSKVEGQQNFVNPGLLLGGLGVELDLTPRLRFTANANSIHFDSTDTIRTALLTNQVGRDFGIDLSAGFQWRPLLKDNVIVSGGYGLLLPGRGFRDIYRRVQPGVAGFTATPLAAEVEEHLHSAVLAVTLTY